MLARLILASLRVVGIETGFPQMNTPRAQSLGRFKVLGYMLDDAGLYTSVLRSCRAFRSVWSNTANVSSGVEWIICESCTALTLPRNVKKQKRRGIGVRRNSRDLV